MLLPHVSDGAIEVGDLTDQNLQARIRGVVWMAMSNEHGWLALTAGNKSEAAVGYSTLYGDTAGAFAVIKDVWKSTVYELGQWRNEVAIAEVGSPIIPESVLTKAPSAELRPDQTDDQSLPPYDVLDNILSQAIEGRLSSASIEPPEDVSDEVAQGIVRRLDRNEYKRRQSPLVLRTSEKAFGGGRRLPIVHRYTG